MVTLLGRLPRSLRTFLFALAASSDFMETPNHPPPTLPLYLPPVEFCNLHGGHIGFGS
ncbi:hypothetical protein RIF25_16095 [Thermosynechococcaceae cyanobacterium BACA0444]|uniref:Uncharacterized protein n=1 Tax=Pseudocalidococcus azoricus BACA0444 TaxID=2918990 RepID=A0AAE4FW15_9CYAN|nr:hypothetical protein [Pseudocalidococcus azoricus]MDS3862322.1 hypothetical protein [Pseudocalidococcus azoricus BACA0444]